MPPIVDSTSAAKAQPSLWPSPYKIVRMDWLSRAAALPGKTLAVGLALWSLAAMRRTPTVVLNGRVLALFTISPDAAMDALTRLSDARLISASRGRGRRPAVTLLDVDGRAMVLWLDD